MSNNELINLPFHSEGHAMHMQYGVKHSKRTLILEAIDNSDKAIRQNIIKLEENNKTPSEMHVKIFHKPNMFGLLDTGIGISQNDIKEKMLSMYNIDNKNNTGISISGIGIKYLFQSFI